MFHIARKTGHTVGELERVLTGREMIEWSVYFKMENEDHEKALREARNKAPKKGRR